MFDHCLYFNTSSLARQLERAWSEAFQPFKLTPSQAFMLRVILDKPGITYTDLACVLNISKATCSRTVGGLLKRGFVERLQEEDDARSFQLKPTSPALEIHDGLNEAASSVTQRIKKLIGPSTFSQTVEQVRDVGRALN